MSHFIDQKFWVGIILSAVMLIGVACGSDEPEPTPTPVPLTGYNNEEFGFSTQYPENWVVQEEADGTIAFKSAADVVLNTSYNGGSLVQILTLPNIALQSDNPVDTLEFFQDEMLASIESEDEEAEVEQEPTAVTLNNYDAARMIIAARQGTVDAKAEVYIVTGSDLSALIMTIYPTDDEGNFRGAIDSILNNFELAETPEVVVEPTPEPEPTAEPTAEPEPEPTAAEESAAVAPSGDLTTYESTDFNLTLSYPSDWILQEDSGFIAIAPDDNALESQTFEGTGGLVVVGSGDFIFTPEEFLESFVNPSDFIDSAVIIEDIQSFEINGQPAASVTYSGLAEDQDVISKFTAITNGSNFGFTIAIMDPAVESDLLPRLDEITGSIMIIPGEAVDPGQGGEDGSEGAAGTDAADLPFPTPDDATTVQNIGTADAPALNFSTSLNTEEVAEFYRAYAADQGWTEREITTIVNDELVNLVFDGPENGQAFVVQAFLLAEDSTNVNVRFEDI